MTACFGHLKAYVWTGHCRSEESSLSSIKIAKGIVSPLHFCSSASSSCYAPGGSSDSVPVTLGVEEERGSSGLAP